MRLKNPEHSIYFIIGLTTLKISMILGGYILLYDVESHLMDLPGTSNVSIIINLFFLSIKQANIRLGFLRISQKISWKAHKNY